MRIADLVGWRMTLTPKPRMCIAPELRIANPCARLRCIFADYVQTSLKVTKLGWTKTKPSPKQGIRLNVYILLRLTQAFKSIPLKSCPLSCSPPACLRVYYIIKQAFWIFAAAVCLFFLTGPLGQDSCAAQTRGWERMPDRFRADVEP